MGVATLHDGNRDHELHHVIHYNRRVLLLQHLQLWLDLTTA